MVKRHLRHLLACLTLACLPGCTPAEFLDRAMPVAACALQNEMRRTCPDCPPPHVEPGTPEGGAPAAYQVSTQTIIVDVDQLEAIAAEHGPEAAAGVVLHEAGHHVDLMNGRPPHLLSDGLSQLSADYWAGCALGRSAVNAEPLARLLETERAPERAAAVRQGARCDEP